MTFIKSVERPLSSGYECIRSNMDVYTSQRIRLTIIFNEKSDGFLDILEKFA